MISIIISLYNCKKYINETLKSLQNQSYKNFEVILINDNPNVNEFEYINAENLADLEIHYVINDTNLGLIKSLNKGIIISKGKYIMCLGQDDIIKKDHLKNSLNLMDEKISMVFFNSEIINDSSVFTGKYLFEADKKYGIVSLDDFFYNNPVNSCGALLNRENVIRCGLYPENKRYPNFGEWFLWIRLSKLGAIVYSDVNKSCYRRHSNNMTKNVNEYTFYNAYRNYKIDCIKEVINMSDFNVKKIFYLFSFMLFSKFKCIYSYIRQKLKKSIKQIIKFYNIFIKFYIPNLHIINRVNIQSIKTVNVKTILTGKGFFIIGSNINFGFKYGGYYHKTCIELQARKPNSKIIIGENCSFNNNIFLCSINKIEIGNDCLFGHNVEIMDFDGHEISPFERRNGDGNSAPILLKDNIWVGNNVTILKGTIIGENCIIGANSLVKGSFPSNCILAGNPAKIIRKFKNEEKKL